VDHVTTKVPTKRTSDHLNLLYFTAFGIPPVLWLLAERPKAGVVSVEAAVWADDSGCGWLGG